MNTQSCVMSTSNVAAGRALTGTSPKRASTPSRVERMPAPPPPRSCSATIARGPLAEDPRTGNSRVGDERARSAECGVGLDRAIPPGTRRDGARRIDAAADGTRKKTPRRALRQSRTERSRRRLPDRQEPCVIAIAALRNGPSIRVAQKECNRTIARCRRQIVQGALRNRHDTHRALASISATPLGSSRTPASWNPESARSDSNSARVRSHPPVVTSMCRSRRPAAHPSGSRMRSTQ